MSFVSAEFIIFSAIIFVIYFLTPSKLKIYLLLAASYFFYAYWNAYYLVLIVASTLIDYAAARLISASESPSRKKFFLIASLVTNLGILFTFKYFNFFSESFGNLLASFGFSASPFVLDVLLPVGISFYTFQSMAYTIDVYRGRAECEKSFVTFATYIAFFPQLVAGPIERASNLLPQFKIDHRFDYDRVVSGLRLILWGMFKKVVIGDRLGVIVNQVYQDPQQYTGFPLLIATIFFAFQIYCDFSGYTDIAIGTARVLGFGLMENFRQPYLSKSVSEFWRRWHISLSTWFRDYVYIPLGGNRVGSINRHVINLMIVFLLSGLWHGANWTFVIWGALHGAFVSIELLGKRYLRGFARFMDRNRLWYLQWAITMILVLLAWVFFRADSVSDAMYIISGMFSVDGYSYINLLDTFALMPGIGVSLALIGFLLIFDIFNSKLDLLSRLGERSVVVRWGFYYVAVGALFVAINTGHVAQEFIYFQF